MKKESFLNPRELAVEIVRPKEEMKRSELP